MVRAFLVAAVLALLALGVSQDPVGKAAPASALRSVSPTGAATMPPAPAAVPPDAVPSAPAATASRPAPTFPARAAIRAARRFVRGRAGIVSFALVDSRGHMHGIAPNRPYVSASVVKAMLLVAYLHSIGNRLPTPAERGMLGPMIRKSDNDRATDVYLRVGDAGLTALAHRARMRSFSVYGSWTVAQITAADQARFFRHLARFVPPRTRPYARRLLSSVVSWERWGFTRAAQRAGFTAYMKAGWRSTVNGRLVHAVGLFVRGRTRVSLAVLTDGDPSHDYGTATLRGVARRIFDEPASTARHARRPTSGTRRAAPSGAATTAPRAAAGQAPQGAPPGQAGSPAHRRAGLVDVTRDAPGIALDIRYATKRNLTGAPLPGYCQPWALLLKSAARDLARVQRRLRRDGLGLQVFDAYRPARATRALVRWAERTGRGDLVGTYIARHSRHNAGGAVDLTLVRDGRRLDMGTRYDDLSPRAHTYAATGRALRNRLTLRDAMGRFGFAPYDREWWHFEHRGTTTKSLDLPLGCG